MELESKEARESGSLAKKPGIDKAMGKDTSPLSVEVTLTKCEGKVSL